jgi:beta-N-acetylhexosaminidase
LPDDTAQLIGRLLMVGVRGDEPGSPLLDADLEACERARCRGVILFDQDLPSRSTRNIVNPEQTRRLVGELRRRLGGTDLIVAIDQEGGAVERLTPARGFIGTPPAAEVAMLPPAEQERLAREQAQQLAGLGVNCNFAPCVDLARNPDSDIIAGKQRAYSHDPTVAIACARRVLAAHKRAGVLACLKHFPGHGSAAGDTHLGLVDISLEARPDLELAPYHWLKNDAPMVMTGHLIDRFIDPDLPASLSPKHTADLLRTRIGYRGVVIVDSLDMRAIADRWGLAEACVLAINAGADILLDCNNAPGPERECPAPAMADAIREALDDGRIAGGVERLRESAERIRAALKAG